MIVYLKNLIEPFIYLVHLFVIQLNNKVEASYSINSTKVSLVN